MNDFVGGIWNEGVKMAFIPKITGRWSFHHAKAPDGTDFYMFWIETTEAPPSWWARFIMRLRGWTWESA